MNDNPLVRDALRSRLDLTPGLRLAGELPSAEGLVETARHDCQGLVLLDLDVPGPAPFAAWRNWSASARSLLRGYMG